MAEPSIYFGCSIVVAPPFELVYVTSAVNITSSASYTFAATSIGAASAYRTVVVGVLIGFSADADNISTLTVGGISATKRHEVIGILATFKLSLWTADVPTGTTADIVITPTTGNITPGFVHVWRMLNGNPVPTTTGSDNSTPLSQSQTIPVGGVGIGWEFTHDFVSAPVSAVIWTNLTERADTISGGAGNYGSSCADSTTSGTLTRSLTRTGSNEYIMGLATFVSN